MSCKSVRILFPEFVPEMFSYPKITREMGLLKLAVGLVVLISPVSVYAVDFTVVSKGYGYSLALGDLNGDGNLDAFVGYKEDEPDRVFINNGSGGFSATGQELGEYDTYSVALGDIDGDGDLDAISAHLDQPNHVWMNNGAGVFFDSGQTLGDSASLALALADIDSDGDLDLVEAVYATANLVWFNDGTGDFLNSGQELGESNSATVQLGDVDGDLDAVIGNYAQSSYVWINNGSGVFGSSSSAMTGKKTTSLGLGDIDNDGDLDVVATNYTQDADDEEELGSLFFLLPVMVLVLAMKRWLDYQQKTTV